jgi:hypothetical protein
MSVHTQRVVPVGGGALSLVEVGPEFRGLRRHLAPAPPPPTVGWGVLPVHRPVCGLRGGLTLRTPAEWRGIKGAPLEGWAGRPMCPRCAAHVSESGASARVVPIAG